ncbi:Thiol:disulfide interchange protein DsbD [bacterium HR40]|nr:Thiol:disulfide interchange protein DsbD [bacterium HR40]
MYGIEISEIAALLGGLSGFASPCVLPLVPLWLCYLTGLTLDQLTGERRLDPALSRRLLVAALAFVSGFAIVFVAMGASASVIGRWLASHAEMLARLSGLLFVLFGLQFLGVLRLPWLSRELRVDPGGARGLLGSFLFGVAFAFSWTPCVGPVLAAILALAAREPTAAEGAWLLALYAAGLGFPFLVAAFAIRPFLGLVARFRRHLRIVERLAGAVLAFAGALLVSGQFDELSALVLRLFPDLPPVG